MHACVHVCEYESGQLGWPFVQQSMAMSTASACGWQCVGAPCSSKCCCHFKLSLPLSAPKTASVYRASCCCCCSDTGTVTQSTCVRITTLLRVSVTGDAATGVVLVDDTQLAEDCVVCLAPGMWIGCTVLSCLRPCYVWELLLLQAACLKGRNQCTGLNCTATY